jgi:hypothetical protein
MTSELALPNNRSSRVWRDRLVPTAVRTRGIAGLIVPGLVGTQECKRIE